jgi:hypothetical protein
MAFKRRTTQTLIDEVENLYNSVLKGELFPGLDDYEKEVNQIATMIAEYRQSGDAKKIVTAMRMQPALKTAIIRMIHGTDDPKEVLLVHIKHALQNVSPVRHSGTFSRVDQRKSIDGPTKAIRIKCLECQGQDTVAVRQCAAVTCVLWPFRMGMNPLYGRLRGAPSDQEDNATDTEEEIEAMEAMRMLGPQEQKDADNE